MADGGLYDDPFDPGWGTELTRFSVAVARQRPGLQVLRAFAHPDNIGSHRVLAKSGFRQERFVPEMNRWLYGFDLRDG